MTENTRIFPVKILLIEDNPGDVRLVQEAIHDCGRDIELVVSRDGEQAMEFLQMNSGPNKKSYPALILLDLNLPRKNGREVLAELKANPLLRAIPVIVFTASQAETDILAAYNLHANCYVPKPIDLEDYIHSISAIIEFWLDLVKLPESLPARAESRL